MSGIEPEQKSSGISIDVIRAVSNWEAEICLILELLKNHSCFKSVYKSWSSCPSSVSLILWLCCFFQMQINESDEEEEAESAVRKTFRSAVSFSSF